MALGTPDCPSLPSETELVTISRSVIIPTRLSFSPTGRKPTSSFAIRLAISSSVSFGLASWTLRVMQLGGKVGCVLNRQPVAQGPNWFLLVFQIIRRRFPAGNPIHIARPNYPVEERVASCCVHS